MKIINLFVSILYFASCNNFITQKNANKKKLEEVEDINILVSNPINDPQIYDNINLENHDSKHKRSPRKRLLKINSITAEFYNKLSETQRKMVRKKDFKDREFYELHRQERIKINLNALNDYGKAFGFLKLKKKNIHKVYSTSLLGLQILLVSLLAKNLQKTNYYISLNCSEEKYKHEIDCTNACGDDCTLIYKEGRAIIDILLIMFLCIGIYLSLSYLYFSFDPYLINLKKFLKNCCNKLKKLFFGEEPLEDRYIEVQDLDNDCNN